MTLEFNQYTIPAPDREVEVCVIRGGETGPASAPEEDEHGLGDRGDTAPRAEGGDLRGRAGGQGGGGEEEAQQGLLWKHSGTGRHPHVGAF